MKEFESFVNQKTLQRQKGIKFRIYPNRYSKI